MAFNMLTRAMVDSVTITINDPNITGVRKCNSVVLENGSVMDLFCSDNPPQSELERAVRGTVFVGESMVVRGFPYNVEMVVEEEDGGKAEEELAKFMDAAMGHLKIYRAIEGTLIRVFNYDGKWFISTHRKLDANKSRWGNGKSFGETFEGAVKAVGLSMDNFLLRLDKAYCYTFLMTSTMETYFVCEPQHEPNLFVYAVTKLNPSTNENEWVDVSLDDINIPRQPQLDLNAFEIIQWTKQLNFPFDHAGILILNSKTFETLKVINKAYSYFYGLRQNEASIPFAYLGIFGNDVDALNFKKLYPHVMDRLNQYDELIDDLIHELYNLYVRRFIRKENFTTFAPKHFILNNHIHRWFMDHNPKDRKRTLPVTADVVRAIVMNDIEPSILNKCLNNARREEAVKTKYGSSASSLLSSSFSLSS